MYVIGGFEFHINENKSDIHIGDIEDEIPAEKTKRLMSIEKATSILENYINQ